MIIEITIPRPGESINEVTLANWLVDDGSYVEKDQEIAEIESDKATLPLIAIESGKLEILIVAGSTARVGDIACKINTEQKGKPSGKIAAFKDDAQIKVKNTENEKDNIDPQIIEVSKKPAAKQLKVTPVAQNLMNQYNLSLDDIMKGLGRIGKNEVEMVLSQKNDSIYGMVSPESVSRKEERKPLSPLRKKLSERLVSVKNQTAMLTTFNEVDMSRVMEIRKFYQDKFVEKFEIKLGLMSFFAKAASVALKLFPNVNSMIDGDELVHFDYSDIGIAVQTDKGLMVPVLRNTEVMGLADIEKQIADLATRARKFRISIDEMSGGTFTITNGGIFGSMLSTPILNPPQAAILGMHNIVDRPVAIKGKVEIRPVMYLALSYDHRIIDGRDSVGFLRTIKELIEEPLLMLSQGKNPERILLDI